MNGHLDLIAYVTVYYLPYRLYDIVSPGLSLSNLMSFLHYINKVVRMIEAIVLNDLMLKHFRMI